MDGESFTWIPADSFAMSQMYAVLPWPDKYCHFSSMELIHKWLSGNKNFIVGAILYKKFGTDAKLKKLFEGAHDAYKHKRLEEELRKLLQKPKLVVQVDKKLSEAGEMAESKDPVLKAIREEWTKPYQRMKYLQGELDRTAGSESFPLYDINTINSKENIAKRKEIAFEILELEQECMRIWKRRNYYLQEGKLPEVKEKKYEVPTDPVELGRKIETLKRNIRRNKERAEKFQDKPQYPLLQKQYEEELEFIMKMKGDGKQSA